MEPTARKSLSAGHRGDLQTENNLTLGPDKNFVWVVSNRPRKCRFVVDRINLKTGKTTLVKRGKGRAYARVHDGGFYLQVREETRAFQRFDQPWEEGTPLPLGVGFLHPECGFR